MSNVSENDAFPGTAFDYLDHGFRQLDYRGNAAYCMNIEDEESTIKRKAQSIEVIAGVITALKTSINMVSAAALSGPRGWVKV